MPSQSPGTIPVDQASPHCWRSITALISLITSLLAACLLVPSLASAQTTPLLVQSPDHQLSAQLVLRGNYPELTVMRHHQQIFQVQLGRVTARALHGHTLFYRVSRGRLDEHFTTLSDKRFQHHLQADSLTISFHDQQSLSIDLANDGLAFRSHGFFAQAANYQFPTHTQAWLERSAKNPQPYQTSQLRTARGNYNYPALLTDHAGTSVSLSETDLPFGDHLEHLRASGDNRLTIANAGHQPQATTGWRIAIIGSYRTIVDSDLALDFAGKSRISNTDWIHPGKATWSGWADGYLTSAAEQLSYIAFADREHFRYVILGPGWQAGWLPELITDGQPYNVHLLVTTTAQQLAHRRSRRRLLQRFAQERVAGIIVDHFTNSRTTLTEMNAIAETAAHDHLVVDFRSTAVPEGIERVWPNVLSFTAVAGASDDRPDQTRHLDDPASNITLAFTRNVIGPMDFGPTTFSAPRASSAGAELAQAIVDQSGLQVFPDSPDVYALYPAAERLLRQLPTSWQQTMLLSGAPGSSVTIARRSGSSWFIGAMLAGPAQTQTISPTFLQPHKRYLATIYSDDGSGGLIISRQTLVGSQQLNIWFDADGGAAIVIRPEPAHA